MSLVEGDLAVTCENCPLLPGENSVRVDIPVIGSDEDGAYVHAEIYPTDNDHPGIGVEVRVSTQDGGIGSEEAYAIQREIEQDINGCKHPLEGKKPGILGAFGKRAVGCPALHELMDDDKVITKRGFYPYKVEGRS